MGRSILLATPGDEVSFPVRGGDHLGLIMVEHAWSGEVDIQVGRRHYSVDLYSPDQRSRTFEVPLPLRAVALDVTIRLSGRRHPESKDSQAWIYAAYLTEDATVSAWRRRARQVAARAAQEVQGRRHRSRPAATPEPEPVPHAAADQSAWAPDPARVQPVGDGLVFVRGVEADLLTLTNDVGISNDIRTVGTWAARDVALFKKLLAPGSFALDIGANLGHHTVVLSRAVTDRGLVVACEPQRIMFGLLETNLFLNGCGNVDALRCALGDKAGQVTLWPADYASPTNFGAVGVYDEERSDWTPKRRGETVELATVDEILVPYRRAGRRVDFVKIDVQAFELPCLRGGTEMLAGDHPTIFLEISPYWMQHLVGYDYRDIYRLLWEFDYEIFEPHTSLSEPAGIREWTGEQLEEWDILAVPKRLR